MTNPQIELQVQTAAQAGNLEALLQLGVHSPSAINAITQFKHQNLPEFIHRLCQIASSSAVNVQILAYVHLSSALRFPRYDPSMPRFFQLNPDLQGLVTQALMKGLESANPSVRQSSASGFLRIAQQFASQGATIKQNLSSMFEALLGNVQTHPESSLGLLTTIYEIFNDKFLLYTHTKKFSPSLFAFCVSALSSDGVPIEIRRESAKAISVLICSRSVTCPENESMSLPVLLQIMLANLTVPDEELIRYSCDSIISLFNYGYKELTLEHFSSLFTAIQGCLQGDDPQLKQIAIHLWDKIVRIEVKLLRHTDTQNQCKGFTIQLADNLTTFLFGCIAESSIEDLSSDDSNDCTPARASYNCLKSFGELTPEMIFAKSSAFLQASQEAMSQGVINSTIAAFCAIQIISGLRDLPDEVEQQRNALIFQIAPQILNFSAVPNQAIKKASLNVLLSFADVPEILDNQDFLGALFQAVQNSFGDPFTQMQGLMLLSSIFNSTSEGAKQKILSTFNQLLSMLDQLALNSQEAIATKAYEDIMLLISNLNKLSAMNFVGVYDTFLNRFAQTMDQNMPSGIRGALSYPLMACLIRMEGAIPQHIRAGQLLVAAILRDVEEATEYDAMGCFVQVSKENAASYIAPLLPLLHDLLSRDVSDPVIGNAACLMGNIFKYCIVALDQNSLAPILGQYFSILLNDEKLTMIKPEKLALLLTGFETILSYKQPAIAAILVPVREHIMNMVESLTGDLEKLVISDIDSTRMIIAKLFGICGNLTEMYYEEETPQGKGQFSIWAILKHKALKNLLDKVNNLNIMDWDYTALIMLLSGSLKYPHIYRQINTLYHRKSLIELMNKISFYAPADVAEKMENIRDKCRTV